MHFKTTITIDFVNEIIRMTNQRSYLMYQKIFDASQEKSINVRCNSAIKKIVTKTTKHVDM